MKANRDAWLAERRLGLGGSDMASLFELDPHGCLLRLWYDKSGVPPDFPAEDAPLLRRGRALEDLAAEEYTLQTGRKLRRRGAQVSAAWPWARVNVDRVIVNVERGYFDTRPAGGTGPLEIKTMGREPFARLKREGQPSRAHSLQVQHAMLVLGASWGAFAALQPDTWQLWHRDIERDQDAIDEIVKRGNAFWPTVTARPYEASMPPHAPTDPRCRACAWRQRCHGMAAPLAPGLSPEELAEPLPQVESLTELLVDYESAKRAADDADATLDLIRDELKLALVDAQVTAAECFAGRVYHRTHRRENIDTKALRAAEPLIAARFTRSIDVQTLRVYPRTQREEND